MHRPTPNEHLRAARYALLSPPARVGRCRDELADACSQVIVERHVGSGGGPR